MKQVDWVGGVSGGKPFKDIRNQRDAVAEEKARLCLRLGELVNKVPPSLATGGSVNAVRAWKVERDAAAKVAGNKRASVHDLNGAIANMARFFK